MSLEILRWLEYAGFYVLYPDLSATMWAFSVSPPLPLWARFAIVIAHSMLWIALKTWLAYVCIPKRRHRQAAASSQYDVTTLDQNCQQQLWPRIKTFFEHLYAALSTLVGHKKVTHRFFFWCDLEPHGQKIGCVALAVFWKKFQWRGFLALCFGASIQVSIFTLLYWKYGEAFAKKGILWILIPMGILTLVVWLVRKNRN